MDPDADGPVRQVAHARLRRGVIINVNYAVQVLGHDARHLVQLLKVKRGTVGAKHCAPHPSLLRLGVRGAKARLVPSRCALVAPRYEPVQRNAGQVAHRRLPLVRVLHNLRTQVGRPNDAHVLLVRFFIDGVLVAQVRRARLHLAVQDAEPQVARLHLPTMASLRLVSRIQRVKFVAVHVRQPRALVRAKQAPVRGSLHAGHEEVRHPQRVKQVAPLGVLVPVVHLHLQEVRNVRVPRLQIHRNRAVALAALINVARRVVEHAQHGHHPVGHAVRPANVAPRRPNVVHVHANAPRVLGNIRALLQRVENSVNAVALHGNQVAAAQLRPRCARVEQRGRGVREVLLRHQVVRGAHLVQIRPVYPHRYTQPHVLRPFHRCAVCAHQVRTLQRLEPEVVYEKVTRHVNHGLQLVAIIANDGPELVADEGRRLAAHIHEFVQLAHGLIKCGRRGFVVVGHDDVGSQRAVVGVLRGHGGALLRRELVYLCRGNAVVQLVNDLHGERRIIHCINAGLSAHVPNAGQYLVKGDDLVLAVALDHAHVLIHVVHLLTMYNVQYIARVGLYYF